MNRLIKHLPLVLFVALFGKMLVVPFSLIDVSALIVVGGMSCFFMLQLEKEQYRKILKELDTTKLRIEEYKEEVKRINIALVKAKVVSNYNQK